jgi:hypothetical protein
MRNWLRTGLYRCTLLSATFVGTACFAQTYEQNQTPAPQNSLSSQNWSNNPQNWKNSPDNWQNSSQNWQNNSDNWKNSPQNWENSGQNYNSTNGIYDAKGNRTGYMVPRGDGGINYFNNDGTRMGYQPGH